MEYLDKKHVADECSDMADTARLLIFIWWVQYILEGSKKLAAPQSLTNITEVDFFCKAHQPMEELDLHCCKLASIHKGWCSKYD